MAGEAGFGRGIGLEEGGDSGIDAGGVRRGDGDVSTGFEGCFCNRVADSGGAAYDEDAGGGKLRGVFRGVGCGRHSDGLGERLGGCLGGDWATLANTM